MYHFLLLSTANLSLSCTFNKTLSIISQNLNRSHNSEHIPLEGNVLLCINQHTTFEVPSFTDTKDVIGAKFKKLAPYRD